MSAPRLRLLAVGMVRDSAGASLPSGRRIEGEESAAAVLRALLPEDREGFAVILLDTRHKTIGATLVSVGSLDATIVHPREVFKAAILANASAIIIGHNHPSGETNPSDEDLNITRRLSQAGELLGIALLDHVIIGASAADPVFSMRAKRTGAWGGF